MVSFHQVLAERSRTEVPAELEASSKKRKWEEPLITEEFFKDHSTIESNPQKRKSIFDIELHLETPFPSNKLQQYLSLQSGIHLCNTRANMKAPYSKISPEIIPEPPSCGQMSLDLELNLTSCESLSKKEEYYSCDINEKKSTSSGSPATVMMSLCERDLLINESRNNNNNNNNKNKNNEKDLSSSWLSIEGGDDHKEMVATVCMRCHMLVMLCKSSPSCPNCKFMHPPDQNPSFLMKRRRCSLLC